jgi:hypothetical protein
MISDLIMREKGTPSRHGLTEKITEPKDMLIRKYKGIELRQLVPLKTGIFSQEWRGELPASLTIHLLVSGFGVSFGKTEGDKRISPVKNSFVLTMYCQRLSSSL